MKRQDPKLKFTVGVGELKTATVRGCLVTYALGTCVAVCGYDRQARVGGLLHALLPSGCDDSVRSQQEPTVFVDTGVMALQKALQVAGAKLSLTEHWLVGGANVFGGGPYEIGVRNIESAKRTLRELGIRLAGEDVGGDHSRTVRLDVETGGLTVERRRVV